MSVLERPAVRRVAAALAARDHPTEVVALQESARTAAEAAAALATTPAAIVNSLVFVTSDGEPVLVLASGGAKVDLEVAAAALDVTGLGRADPEVVRGATGFAIGGVAPVGHPTPLPTLVDLALAGHERIWAAAGHPHAVFATTFDDLLELTGGQPSDLR